MQGYKNMNQLRVIKIIVLIFTFLLIGACVLLLGGLSKKTFLSSQLPPVTNLSQPVGSTIKQIESNDGLLHILISGGQLPDRIVTYNPQDKQIESNLLLYEDNNEQQ